MLPAAAVGAALCDPTIRNSVCCGGVSRKEGHSDYCSSFDSRVCKFIYGAHGVVKPRSTAPCCRCTAQTVSVASRSGNNVVVNRARKGEATSAVVVSCETRMRIGGEASWRGAGSCSRRQQQLATRALRCVRAWTAAAAAAVPWHGRKQPQAQENSQVGERVSASPYCAEYVGVLV